jgi:hypothetical protein
VKQVKHISRDSLINLLNKIDSLEEDLDTFKYRYFYNENPSDEIEIRNMEDKLGKLNRKLDKLMRKYLDQVLN